MCKLNNGTSIPMIGLGTWDLKESRAITTAIVDNGYRLIDNASHYKNEEQIGVALKEIFAAGEVKREDIII